MLRRLKKLPSKAQNAVRALLADTINIYVIDRGNIGDLSCAPFRYFQIGPRCFSLDVHTTAFLSGKNLIFGGGGLLYHRAELDAILRRTRPRKLIAWGLGTNSHETTAPEPAPEWLRSFDLAGVRDFGFSEFTWVPCASALHRAFDSAAAPTTDVVVYEHKDHPLGIADFPVRTNHGDQTIEDVIRFLASADTVITNSYHGVYWATLLNRRVLCLRPFSSKFARFKHAPVIVSRNTWKEALGRAVRYPEALVECRDANASFAKRVGELLEVEITPTELHFMNKSLGGFREKTLS